MDKITKDLFLMQDTSYCDFHSKLIPEIEKDRIIGVRTPILRKYANRIFGTEEAEEFVRELPHVYYDENNLHAFLIEKTRDFDECVKQLEAFFPHIDNWATCDMMSPKVLGRFPERLLEKCREWMSLPYTYAKRYSLVMLIKHFTKNNFTSDIIALAVSERSSEYYVKMAQAWFLAEAAVFHFDEVLSYMRHEAIDPFVKRVAVRKACESFRVSDCQKAILKALTK